MTSPGHLPNQRGFTVFEVMLALTIFSFVMLGLSLGLQQTMEASILAQKESRLRHELESRLAQIRQQPLQVGLQKIDEDDQGVQYESEISVLELKNQRQLNLNNLYRVIIRARWPENGVNEERTASLYVYQP